MHIGASLITLASSLFYPSDNCHSSWSKLKNNSITLLHIYSVSLFTLNNNNSKLCIIIWIPVVKRIMYIIIIFTFAFNKLSIPFLSSSLSHKI